MSASSSQGNIAARLAELGSCLQDSRTDVPPIYSLRVAWRACDDMGIEYSEESETLDATITQHPVASKFVQQFTSSPALINKCKPIQAVKRGTVSGQKHYTIGRIKLGEWRGAVWWDAENGIKWLCRVVALSNYSDEEKAYRALAALHKKDQLLPSLAERARHRRGCNLARLVHAFLVAALEAENQQDKWVAATVELANGSTLGVGRVRIEKIEEEDEAITTRFMILLRKPPTALPLPSGWREMLFGALFHPDITEYPIKPAYDHLPPGTRVTGRELAVMQVSFDAPDT